MLINHTHLAHGLLLAYIVHILEPDRRGKAHAARLLLFLLAIFLQVWLLPPPHASGHSGWYSISYRLLMGLLLLLLFRKSWHGILVCFGLWILADIPVDMLRLNLAHGEDPQTFLRVVLFHSYGDGWLPYLLLPLKMITVSKMGILGDLQGNPFLERLFSAFSLGLLAMVFLFRHVVLHVEGIDPFLYYFYLAYGLFGGFYYASFRFVARKYRKDRMLNRLGREGYAVGPLLDVLERREAAYGKAFEALGTARSSGELQEKIGQLKEENLINLHFSGSELLNSMVFHHYLQCERLGVRLHTRFGIPGHLDPDQELDFLEVLDGLMDSVLRGVQRREEGERPSWISLEAGQELGKGRWIGLAMDKPEPDLESYAPFQRVLAGRGLRLRVRHERDRMVVDVAGVHMGQPPG
ncbi:hypothetical protein [Anaerotalea alkaliphila]|uniref:Uncharacterized protein n=1 Tax=Anaerotalea alkaliphila TaxID=2662126 RepID=A0A7X5HVB6_9FIRM|nr:hypothetical protein [Anaerotalea alkaliphila]NDL67300.1 hypothetical protein [Anaerotalea alkaliphila]